MSLRWKESKLNSMCGVDQREVSWNRNKITGRLYSISIKSPSKGVRILRIIRILKKEIELDVESLEFTASRLLCTVRLTMRAVHMILPRSKPSDLIAGSLPCRSFNHQKKTRVWGKHFTIKVHLVISLFYYIAGWGSQNPPLLLIELSSNQLKSFTLMGLPPAHFIRRRAWNSLGKRSLLKCNACLRWMYGTINMVYAFWRTRNTPSILMKRRFCSGGSSGKLQESRPKEKWQSSNYPEADRFNVWFLLIKQLLELKLLNDYFNL